MKVQCINDQPESKIKSRLWKIRKDKKYNVLEVVNRGALGIYYRLRVQPSRIYHKRYFVEVFEPAKTWFEKIAAFFKR